MLEPEVAPSGDFDATHLPQAPGGAAAVLHGGAAQPGRAPRPHPGHDQGEVRRPSIPWWSGASAGGARHARARGGSGGPARDRAHRVPRTSTRSTRWPTSAALRRNARVPSRPTCSPNSASRATVLRAAHETRALPVLDQLGLPHQHAHRRRPGDAARRRRDRHRRVPARRRRAAVRPLADLRPRGARARRRVPAGARPARWAPSTAAQGFRGQRHRAQRGDLRLPRSRGAGGPGDVPALLREAEDGRRGLPDLRRRLAARGRRPSTPCICATCACGSSWSPAASRCARIG